MKKSIIFILGIVSFIIVCTSCSNKAEFTSESTTAVVDVLRIESESSAVDAGSFNSVSESTTATVVANAEATTETTTVAPTTSPSTTIQTESTTQRKDVDRNYSFASSDQIEMLNAINSYRRANGLNELVLNKGLCKAAAIRAQEQISREGHVRPDGSKAYTVISECNIGIEGFGENAACNVRAVDGKTVSENAMDGFKNSPSHDANLLHDTWNYVGLGFYTDSEGYTFVVQIFVKEVY